MPRRTAALIERGPEEWTLVADGLGNEKHFMVIEGAAELLKVRAVFERLLAEDAGRAEKCGVDPFDVLEATA